MGGADTCMPHVLVCRNLGKQILQQAVGRMAELLFGSGREGVPGRRET